MNTKNPYIPSSLIRNALVGTSMAMRLLLIVACLTGASCGSSGSNDPSAESDTMPAGGSADGSGGDEPNGAGAGDSEDLDSEDPNPENPDSGVIDDGTSNTGDFTLPTYQSAFDILEGAAINVPVSINRNNGHQRTVSLTASVPTDSFENQLLATFVTSELVSDVTQTSLSVVLLAGKLKAIETELDIVITADDGLAQSSVRLQLNVKPTNKPDIYLLIGQSNMVGFSELNAKDLSLASLDATDSRIQQLNVTANDTTNFTSPADFTKPENQVAFPDFITAEDPLHASRDPSVNQKTGTRIGLGMSFAKRALLSAPDTTIILVPAAWSTTGFCNTGEYLGQNPEAPQWIIDGELGWNPFPLGDPAFGGTTLFNRAVLRANMAIERSGGILRGILWHQGESDGENPICSDAYAANLATLATELRTRIIEDSRGPAARGSSSDVPFIVGTMSRGIDSRGNYSVLSDSKQTVDTTHRLVASQPLINHSGVALFDDLTPTNEFPCGEGACVHFGAASYRKMGERYFEVLDSVLNQ